MQNILWYGHAGVLNLLHSLLAGRSLYSLVAVAVTKCNKNNKQAHTNTRYFRRGLIIFFQNIAKAFKNIFLIKTINQKTDENKK